jgi:predicted HTH transcriptional regulator|tara:strand:- start:760 stop:1461 length:702 start_codon:yes stop_codon:yes gene_type:complete
MSFVLKLIEEGEHLNQDFKLRIDDSRKIAKTMSGFANTDGGRLLIGVKDNGNVAGCIVSEEYHMIEAASNMYCRPAINFDIQVWKVGHLSVLEVKILKSNSRPHFVEGVNDNGVTKWDAYIRREDRIHKANSVMVKVMQYQMRQERSEFRYDIYVGNLFSAWREGRELRFVQVAKITKMGFEEVENLLALLIVWAIVRAKHSKRGYIYELADEEAMGKLETEGWQVFRYKTVQ